MIESYIQYLTAKKTIDDRSLNKAVWARLDKTLTEHREERAIRVLEVGCGIGTMVERFLECGILRDCHYTAVDLEPAFIEHAITRLPRWASEHRFSVDDTAHDKLKLTSVDGSHQIINFVAADVLALSPEHLGLEPWDLIIAHSFLDLVDLDTVVPSLLALLQREGLFYFTLNFDGLTKFLPEIDPEYDLRLMELYHRTMDERMSGGKMSEHSQTGQRLFGVLRRIGAHILAVGSSDWVVMAPREESDETIFLHYIVETVHDALSGHSELDHAAFKTWIDTRRTQIDRGELVYIAHQLDFLGRRVEIGAREEEALG